MLHPHSKKMLSEAIQHDTAFLSSANVMDYSLLIGVNEEDKELIVGIVGKFLIVVNISYALDYIGTYTWYKKLENKGKTALTGKEGTVIPPNKYADRFRNAMDQYFVMVPGKYRLIDRHLISLDKWIKIPRDSNGLPPVF